MARRSAYLGALKFHFGNQVVCEGKPRREAWSIARYLAATYAFRVKS